MGAVGGFLARVKSLFCGRSNKQSHPCREPRTMGSAACGQFYPTAFHVGAPKQASADVRAPILAPVVGWIELKPRVARAAKVYVALAGRGAVIKEHANENDFGELCRVVAGEASVGEHDAAVTVAGNGESDRSDTVADGSSARAAGKNARAGEDGLHGDSETRAHRLVHRLTGNAVTSQSGRSIVARMTSASSVESRANIPARPRLKPACHSRRDARPGSAGWWLFQGRRDFGELCRVVAGEGGGNTRAIDGIGRMARDRDGDAVKPTQLTRSRRDSCDPVTIARRHLFITHGSLRIAVCGFRR